MAEIQRAKIKLRQGVEADIPSLDVGEPAFTTDTKKFFVGASDGNVQFADNKSLEDIKGDVASVETEVSTVKENLQTTQADVNGVKTNVTNLQKDMGTAQANIQTLDADMQDVKSEIQTLDEDMTTVKGEVSTLHTDMNTAKSDISTLKTDTGTLKTDTGKLKTDVSKLQGVVGTSSEATTFGNDTAPTEIKGKDKVNVSSPLLQVEGKEVYNQGNFSNHVILNSVTATQDIVSGNYTKLTALDTVVSSYPAGSVTEQSFTIPRSGVYVVDLTIKLTADLAETIGYVRFGVKLNDTTDVDMQDVLYSNANLRPILKASFVRSFSKGDVIYPQINPLTESIGVGAGSSFSVYFLGDRTPAAPQNLQFTSTTNSTTVTWDAVPDATSYKVYRGAEKVFYKEVTEPSCLVENISADTNLSINVTAVNSLGESPMSYIKTKTEPAS